MPPSRTQNTTASGARVAPYPMSDTNAAVLPSKDQSGLPAPSTEDKENQAPATQKPKKTSTHKEPDRSHLPESYLDIALEERKGEVPIYETCSAVRRKLKKLMDSKVKIPGTNKTFNQSSLSAEMRRLAQKEHPVEFKAASKAGPAPVSVGRWMALRGSSMRGADGEVYYWGNMLLEKLRIWNAEKKTKAREEEERKFPNGRQRWDPSTNYVFCFAGERPSVSEYSNVGR